MLVPRRQYYPPIRRNNYRIAAYPAMPVAAGMVAKQLPKIAKAAYRFVRGASSKPEATNAKKAAVRKPKRKTIMKRGSSIKKQMRDIRRTIEADTGTHISRVRSVGALASSNNLNNYTNVDLCTVSSVETVLGQLRYYNPSVPGTLTNADGAAGTFQKEFLFKSIYHKIHIRNNYQVPAYVSAYIVVPKEDTDINTSTAFTNGLNDVGSPSSYSPLVHFTDSTQVNDLFKVVASKKILLEPGETFNMIHSTKPFQYDPSFIDNHGLTYQRKFGGAMLFIMIKGEIAHDTSAAERGTSACGIDYMIDTTYIVRYSAGADIRYIVVTDGSSSFTNSAVLSNKPVSDNQSLSVA